MVLFYTSKQRRFYTFLYTFLPVLHKCECVRELIPTSEVAQSKQVTIHTRQDKTRQDKTRQDKTRQDKPRQDKTRQDKTGQDKTRQDGSKS